MPICDTAPPLQMVEPGHLSRCWLTPNGEPPAVGAAAPADVAEAEAARLSVETVVPVETPVVTQPALS